MKRFLYGFFTALLLVMVTKEVAYYRYLQFVDATSYFDKDGYHGSDEVPPSSWIQHRFQRGYIGESLTGRCTADTIKYWQCDKFQVWISNKFYKENK